MSNNNNNNIDWFEIIIGLLLIIISLINIVNTETHIETKDCYDKSNSIIIGLICEREVFDNNSPYISCLVLSIGFILGIRGVFK